eukprot:Awhi_evm1s12015
MSVKQRKKITDKRRYSLSTIPSNLPLSASVPGVDVETIKFSWKLAINPKDPNDFPNLLCQEMFYAKLFKLLPEAKPFFHSLKEQAVMFSGMMRTIVRIDDFYSPYYSFDPRNAFEQDVSLDSVEEIPSATEKSNSIESLKRKKTRLSNNRPLSASSYPSKLSPTSSENEEENERPNNRNRERSLSGSQESNWARLMSVQGYDHLRALGKQHIKLGVTIEMYPVVTHSILCFLEQRLGSIFTPEVKNNWQKAIEIVAGVMSHTVKRKQTFIGLNKKSDSDRMKKKRSSISNDRLSKSASSPES